MKRCISVKFLSIVFLLVFSLGFGVSASPKTEIQVKITDPAMDGMQVGKDMRVKGTANILGGNYLWVLAHRIEGYEDYWWPQNEAKIDPGTKNWRVTVVFGGPQDIGYDFGIAAIVVNEREHLTLRNYRRNGMKTGDWPPIEMPSTVVAPVIRTVKKVSHN